MSIPPPPPFPEPRLPLPPPSVDLLPTKLSWRWHLRIHQGLSSPHFRTVYGSRDRARRVAERIVTRMGRDEQLRRDLNARAETFLDAWDRITAPDQLLEVEQLIQESMHTFARVTETPLDHPTCSAYRDALRIVREVRERS